MKLKTLLLLSSLLMITTFKANANSFRNSYIAFEMPDRWKCALEQTEWVCRSGDTKESREAIIILTAKEVGPTDTFELYEQHLNNPISTTSKSGTTVKSVSQYKAKKVLVNDQTWIDGLHLGSEVQSYFTRYLATIKDKIAILITFSAHQNYYAKYSHEFFDSVKSLRVIANKNLIAKPELGPIRPGGEVIGAPIGSIMQGQGLTAGESEEEPKSNRMGTYIGIALIIGAIGIYLFLKSKK